MPRIRLLASALALAIVSTAAQAQVFDNYVVIGDSLSDSGNIAHALGLPPGNSFTTNPDPVASQLIAGAFGLPADPSFAGGSDFAWGGACIRSTGLTGPCLNAVPTLGTQINQYLAANGGTADPNSLFSYWGGANDIFGNLTYAGGGFITAAQVQANIIQSAHDANTQISQLQAAGARNIIVFNLPDIGRTPQFVGGPFQSTATNLVLLFNGQLNEGLSGRTGIIPVDTFGLFNEIITDPGKYGFTNVTTPACGVGSSSVACGPIGTPGDSFFYAPGTNLSFAFADGVHPTGGAHAIIAQYVVAEIQAPMFVSMLGEAPLQALDTNNRAIDDQMFADMGHKRPSGSFRSFASFDYSHQRYDATVTSPQTSSNNASLTFGGDYYFNDSVSVGIASTIAHQDANFAGGGGYRNLEPLFSAYGIWRSNDAYVSLIASAGQLNFKDITRSFQLGATTRTESGDTGGSHTGFEIGGGYFFHWGDLKTGPFASYTWQKVKVDSYFENNGDSSAMAFGRQSRKSGIAKLGWQLGGDMGNLHPFARVAWQHESETSPDPIQAGLVTLNGTFVMPGFKPDSSWFTGEVGVTANLGDNLTGYAAYNGRFSDANQRIDSVNLGLAYTF
jgi:outer membrane lipase/esterase